MSTRKIPTPILHVAKAILADGVGDTPDRLWPLANADAKRMAVSQARAAIKAYEEVRL